MLLTAWCIAVVLGSLLAVGVPAVWLAYGRRPLTETNWVEAPFIGLAAVVLILQNLVYLDVPVLWSAPFVWLAAVAGWIWLWRSGQLRVTFARCPLGLYLTMLAVYLTQGLGMLLIGARFYLGRMWGDQCNYTTLAEYFAHQPYSLPVSEAATQPWMILVVRFLRTDRIGQSMLHAFFSVSSFSDPRILFEPTILLCPAMVVLAIYALARSSGMSRGWSTLTGAAAGLLPALASIHLESYQSQALVTPLLVYIPAALYALLRRPTWRRAATLALIVAAAVSIYTEFLPILLVLLAAPTLVGAVGMRRGWRVLGLVALVLAAPVVLNPLSTTAILNVLQRVDIPMLQHVYPWAFKVEGLARLWLGDLVELGQGRLALRAFGLAATGLGFLGLACACLPFLHEAGKTWRIARLRASFALAFAILSLAILPILVVVRDEDHAYQFYKLLLSVSPLLVLGLAQLARAWTADGARMGRMLPVPAAVLLVAVLVGGAAGSAEMAYNSTRLTPPTRIHVGALASFDVQQVQRRLEQMHNEDVLLACTNGPADATGFLASWLAYSARHNRVWSLDPWMFGATYEDIPEAKWYLRPEQTPVEPKVKVLTRTNCFREEAFLGSCKVLWNLGPYSLIQGGDQPWAIPVRLANPNGLGDWGEGRPRIWMGNGATEIDVLATAPGHVEITADFEPGPSLPPNAGRGLSVETSRGLHGEVVLSDRRLVIDVPVGAGSTVLRLTPRDAALPGPLPNGDPRPLLWMVHFREARYRAAPAGH